MKKIIFPFLALSLISFTSCQQEQTTKQYFEQSPEIDIAKKSVDGYLKQDWVTYKSLYSDTARIWYNEYWATNPGLSIGEAIESMKEPLASLVYYRYEGEIWEMIVNNNGDKWVHFWGNWIGKLTADGEEIETVVHLAYRVVGDKIVYESGFWDNLPFYLEQQRLKTESK
jgi:hypothetical protein